MNLSTDDLRKLLEDCWAECHKEILAQVNQGNWTPGKMIEARDKLITSQLSALDGKGEGVGVRDIDRVIENLELNIMMNHAEWARRPHDMFQQWDKDYIEGVVKPALTTTTLPAANQPTGMRWVNDVKYYIGGWREAIGLLEDYCSDPIALKNMTAALNQIDKVVEQMTDETPPTND